MLSSGARRSHADTLLRFRPPATPPSIRSIARRCRCFCRWRQNHGFFECLGGRLVKEQDDARGLLGELRAEALGRRSPARHERCVRVIVVERIAERRCVKPRAQDFTAGHLLAVEGHGCPEFLLQRVPRGLRALHAVASAHPRRAKGGVGLIESRSIGRAERAADGNRQPLVALEPAVVSNVAVGDRHRLGCRRRQRERIPDMHRVSAEGPKDLGHVLV